MIAADADAAGGAREVVPAAAAALPAASSSDDEAVVAAVDSEAAAYHVAADNFDVVAYHEQRMVSMALQERARIADENRAKQHAELDAL